MQSKEHYYLDPMSDLFSRWLLSREETKEILEDLVNATLEHAGKPPVHALELRNPFNLGTAFQEKESILDIRAKDSTGAYINLEVQLGRQSMFFNRVLYYWAKTYSDQLSRGDTYNQLLPVISINLTAHTLFPDLAAWHTLFQLTEEKRPDVALGDHLNIHFVEVRKEKLDAALVPGDKLAAWCYFFRYEGVKEEGIMGEVKEELYEKYPSLKKAHEEYGRFLSDNELMYLAEGREKWLKDYNSNMEDAREEGLKQGIEKGIDKGIEKGKLEDKQDVLTRMFDKKFRIIPSEQELINRCCDTGKLDKALDAMLFAGDRQEVLDELG